MVFAVIELICFACAMVFHRAGMRQARNRTIGIGLAVLAIVVVVIVDSGGAHLS